MSVACKDIQPLVGCRRAADGSALGTVVIHYEYRNSAAGNPVIHATRYTDAVGAPLTLGTGETVSPGACPVDTKQYVKGEPICLQTAPNTYAVGFQLSSVTGTTVTPMGYFNAASMAPMTGATPTSACNCPIDDCTAELLAVSITKAITGYSGNPALAAVGNVITYTISVTNTSNVPLTNVVVTDANATVTSGSPIASLAVGASANVTATHTVTAADLAAGKVDNQANASGTSPAGATVTKTSAPPGSSTPGPTTQTLTAATPQLTVAKTLTSPGPYVAGATLAYQFAVTNTGTGPATNVVVSDPNASGITPATVASLAPGATTNFTGTHLLTAAQAAAGSFVNTATAAGVNPANGTPVTSAPSSVTTTMSTCTSSGTIPATATGPFAAGPCTGQASIAALVACLNANGYTVTATPGSTVLGPTNTLAWTNVVPANGATTVTYPATAGTGSVSVAQTLTSATYTNVANTTGGPAGHTVQAPGTSYSTTYNITNTSGSPVVSSFVIDPRAAGALGGMATNINSFAITYDTSKYTAKIATANASGTFPIGTVVPSGTTVTTTNTAFTIDLVPISTTVPNLATGAVTPITYTQNALIPMNNEMPSIGGTLAVQTTSPTSLTIAGNPGSPLITSVTASNGSNVMTGNCV